MNFAISWYRFSALSATMVLAGCGDESRDFAGTTAEDDAEEDRASGGRGALDTAESASTADTTSTSKGPQETSTAELGEDPAPSEPASSDVSMAAGGAPGDASSTGGAGEQTAAGEEVQVEGVGGDGTGGGPPSSASPCMPGQFLDPENTEDGCSFCATGTWDHDADANTACIAHTRCEAGEHIVGRGTQTEDHACETCVDGYTTEANQRSCLPWQPCLGTEIAEGTPTTPKTCAPVLEVTSGNYHRCALLADGTVSCWGRNNFAQLGIRGLALRAYGQVISGLSSVQHLYSNADYNCALLETGTAKCWGNNQAGQLGGGTTSESEASPLEVSGLANAVDLVLGRYVTCAIQEDRNAVCWGRNQYGQLGNGDSTDSSVPVAVAGLGSVQKMASNGSQTCAIVTGGQVYCFGHDVISAGQRVDTMTPIEIPLPNGQGAEDIVMASGEHVCVLLEGRRELACWGDNQSQEIGPFPEAAFNEPVLYPESFEQVEQLQAATSDTCVLQGGVISCFGAGGLLFDGGRTDGTLVEVPEVTSAQNFSIGSRGGCYLGTDGVPYCWGRNEEGETGRGESGYPQPLPVRVSGGPVEWP